MGSAGLAGSSASGVDGGDAMAARRRCTIASHWQAYWRRATRWIIASCSAVSAETPVVAMISAMRACRSSPLGAGVGVVGRVLMGRLLVVSGNTKDRVRGISTRPCATAARFIRSVQQLCGDGLLSCVACIERRCRQLGLLPGFIGALRQRGDLAVSVQQGLVNGVPGQADLSAVADEVVGKAG